MRRPQQRRLQDRRTERQQFRRGAPAPAGMPGVVPYAASGVLCSCPAGTRAAGGDADGGVPTVASPKVMVRAA